MTLSSFLLQTWNREHFKIFSEKVVREDNRNFDLSFKPREKGKLLTVSVDGAVEYAITILIVDTLLAENVPA